MYSFTSGSLYIGCLDLGDKMTITIQIPRLPESGNKTRKYSGWERQKYRDLWHNEVYIAFLPWLREYEASGGRVDIMGIPWPKAHVIITLYFPDRRRRDEDNMRQGLKYAVDGLKAAGIIEDDEWYPTRKCKVDLVGKYDKEDPRTVIEVEEICEK